VRHSGELVQVKSPRAQTLDAARCAARYDAPRRRERVTALAWKNGGGGPGP
jgi:hypothetical protein